MSFSVRLWIMTFLSFSAFTAWIYLHDDVIRVSPEMSHAMVAVVAWVFGIAGTILINRFHRRAEKLAEKSARDQTAIQMAGAVAHELNQPLTIVITTSELINRRDPADRDLGPYLQRLIDASERMSDIVRKLEHVTGYQTKPYVGTVRIVDLDESSGQRTVGK